MTHLGLLVDDKYLLCPTTETLGGAGIHCYCNLVEPHFWAFLFVVVLSVCLVVRGGKVRKSCSVHDTE